MYKYIKRGLDFILSFMLFIIISPIFLCLMILVRINLGLPIFFLQERSGLGEKKFNIIKFRTMTDKRDDNGNLLANELRMTKFGKILRSSSLDELPELINIIKGDMSIIGPRPLLPEYSPYYTDVEKKRFSVRGGLIPPDSVDVNSIIPWEKQFKYEADYAQNLSFLMDVKILFSVFRIMLQRKSTNYGGFVRKPLSEERSKMCVIEENKDYERKNN